VAVLVATIFVANFLAIVIVVRCGKPLWRKKITPETLLGRVRYLSPRQSVSEEKKPHRIIQHGLCLRASA
jgi:hypothetical protein